VNGRYREKKPENRVDLRSSHGYRVIYERRKGRTYTAFVHRLIWYYLTREEIPKGKTINHKDGNKENNRIDNLEIMTYQENTRHAMEVTGKINNRGMNNPDWKYTDEEIRRMKTDLKNGYLLREVAEKYHVSPSYAAKLRKGRYRKDVVV